VSTRTLSVKERSETPAPGPVDAPAMLSSESNVYQVDGKLMETVRAL
jgi:hypothetical protein